MYRDESKSLPRLLSLLPLLAAGLLLALLVVPVLLSLRVPSFAPVEGRLQPCGAAPNCVSSQADDDAHRVAPLALPESGDPKELFVRFLQRIEARKDARVVMRLPLLDPRRPMLPTYAHCEFVTPFLRFRDDVELALDEAARVVHVRSASRVGYSDLGANRKRVEALRAVLAEGD